MSIDEEKKTFVMKHFFTGVNNMTKNERHYGTEEVHFGIPWSIYIIPYESASRVVVYLTCEKCYGEDEWSIDATIKGKRLKSVKEHVFNKKSDNAVLSEYNAIDIYVFKGTFKVECQVTINKMNKMLTGYKIPKEKHIFRSFDDESAKKFSDTVFSVEDQKFHVCKMYLAAHSTYFQSLLYGNFYESKQSEIELKDIDPREFQKFLEVVYGEPAIDENNIEGILHLADMYDAKTVIRQCEQFLLHRSQNSLKFKFNMALKYDMDQLKKNCISEIKSVADIEKVIPEDRTHLNKEICIQLLELSISLHKQK